VAATHLRLAATFFLLGKETSNCDGADWWWIGEAVPDDGAMLNGRSAEEKKAPAIFQKKKKKKEYSRSRAAIQSK